MSWDRVGDEVEKRVGDYVVRVALEFGPRVTGLRLDGAELFAEVPSDSGVTAPDGEFVPFHGGHRLWVAPEIVAVTYVTDGAACRVDGAGDGLTVIGSVDEAGFVKTISIEPGDDDTLRIAHRLEPGPGAPPTYGSWAITQLPLDGTAIVPLRHTAGSGLQAEQTLALWPYTRLNDPRIEFVDDAVLIRADGGANLKIGAGPPSGRLGYYREGLLFTKTFASVEGAKYPDLGAVAQVFTNEVFIELESTAPLIESGPSVHEEVWRVIECSGLDEAVGQVLLRT